MGNNIDGYTIRFPVTTSYGYSHSDNIIFAQVGVNTGFELWMEYNKRFYIGQQIPFDLPVTPSSVLAPGRNTLADNELAADAFGQGFDAVTPMQMSLFNNAVANDGQLMRPTLISKITKNDGTSIQTFAPQILGTGSQMTSQTAMLVRQAMYGVVRCGSGTVQGVKLVASPWGVIGKTGTAEVGGGFPAHSWLLTQAPYVITNTDQLPSLTIVAMKENGGEGGKTVGPMTVGIYNDVFTTVMKTQLPPIPDPNYCCNAKLLQLGCPA